MPVTNATLRAQRRLNLDLAAVVDAGTRDLVSAWADAWDETSTDLEEALELALAAGGRVTRAQLLRATRLRTVLGVIGRNLAVLAADAGVRIVGDLGILVQQAGSRQAAILSTQLPRDAGVVNLDAWDHVADRTLTAIVRRSTEQVTSLTRPLGDEAYQAVRRELIRSVAAGSNPKDAARRMVARSERRFNGGLSRAMTIARTEMLDAHREGAALGQAQQADVLAGWAWLAKLDARTCRSCWSQHGKVHDLGEPGPLDHQCGRCARMPLAKPWAELGFEIEEPPSVLPDAAELFEPLDPADQLRILGGKGYDAWRRGSFPIEGWSQRRTADGWRDSFAPAQPPSGGRARVAA
jgi:hypothetical protein